MTAHLPYAEQCIVEREKLLDYLLSDTHPDGAAKAAFFRAFGFTPEAWEVLATALRAISRNCAVLRVAESKYGVRYTVDGDLEAPDGRRPRVRTIWIVEHAEPKPRLVTAYPAKRRQS